MLTLKLYAMQVGLPLAFAAAAYYAASKVKDTQEVKLLAGTAGLLLGYRVGMYGFMA